MLQQKTLDFLKDLDQNNNREWFQDHKEDYEIALADFTAFASNVLDGLKQIQPNLLHTEIKKCLLRIYRDVRFSKDKRPYKNYFAAGFGPGGRSSGLVDFYLQISPNQSFLGAGMWQPSPENLAKFRQEIDYNPNDLKSIIFDPKFKNKFNEIHGEKLKTKPKGYDIDHPEIELLRYKELFFTTSYTDNQLCSNNIVEQVIEDCITLKPYQDYLNGLFFE
ncbi:TIGR02453 family protein [Spirosomataceae bacterium TFI 002]|nr:TIGR02453 family protein [Spirosomataceae bacterium TFI 002]